MNTASFSIAILNIFSWHGQYFHPTKDQPRTRPSSTFLYICYNFRQIFCTNVIQFFSVENMGHNQLQKCTKYHLVSLLNEKQGPTFANFLQLFIHVTLLTHSAMELIINSLVVANPNFHFPLSLRLSLVAFQLWRVLKQLAPEILNYLFKTGDLSMVQLT